MSLRIVARLLSTSALQLVQFAQGERNRCGPGGMEEEEER